MKTGFTLDKQAKNIINEQKSFYMRKNLGTMEEKPNFKTKILS